MTDITDQDRRAARALAKNWQGDLDADISAAARVILATVDAPEPTIAEEIMRLPDYTMSGDHCLNDCYDQAKDLAARAEQIEQERDQARSEAKAWEERFRAAKDDSSELAYDLDDMEQRALKAEAEVERLKDAWEELDKQRIDEVQRLTAERVTDPSPTLNDPSMTRHATVAREENVAPDLPDPADVKPGEAWSANIWYDDERHPGTAIKTPGGDWLVCRADGTRSTYRMNEYIDLIAPLVPAPRVITDTDELEAMPYRTVIRDSAGGMFQRIAHGWYQAGDTSAHRSDDNFVCLPATVLWEPEA